MPFAFEMFFDEKSEETLLCLQKKLVENNLPSFMINTKSKPHISLAVYNKLDIQSAESLLHSFCSKNKKLDIYLVYIGTFLSSENVIFAGPNITDELLSLHKNFHNEFSNFRNEVWEYYLPNRWQPHCTISFELPNDKFAHSFQIIRETFKPMKASIESIGLVEFRPVKVIKECSLK